MDYRARQRRLAEGVEAQKLKSLLITHLPNIRYVCGFTGSAGVAAIRGRSGRRQLALFTDGRYTEQARDQTKRARARVITTKGSALIAAAEWVGDGARKSDAVGFESEHMSVAAHQALAKAAPKIRLKPTSLIVERLRMVKDAGEIDQIRSAVLLASQVFEAAIGDIKPGIAENSIAAEIEYLCRRMGAESMSFDTLVAAGPRSALPHGVASSHPVPSRGFVILDFGVILGGYCSDMTRTVHVGRPSTSARAMYQAVLEAQLAGIAAVQPGIKPAEVDYATRNVLQKSGLGRYFTHSTGHGVGLEIHELPGLRKVPKRQDVQQRKLKRRIISAEVLEPGMVITIEPGVYIPGKGGVRIEDMVLVTEAGCEVLTPTGKDLMVI